MNMLLCAGPPWSEAESWLLCAMREPSHWWNLGLFLGALAMAWPGSAFGAGGRSGKVREPVYAGSWYEGDSTALARSIEGHLQGRNRPDVPVPEGSAEAEEWAQAGRRPAAVIVPHAGHVYSGDCAGETFRLLRGCAYSRVVLLGPSHQLAFSGAALPEEDAFRTPLGTIGLDSDAIHRLASEPGFQILPRAHAREHSLEIELPFLQKVMPQGFTLIPIVVGRLDSKSLVSIAQAVQNLWDEHTVVVVSSDFTHYGPNYDYVPFRNAAAENLRRLDMEAIKRIEAVDGAEFEAYRDSTGATICGAEPIRVLLQAARGRHLAPRLIEYYRSGDMMGDFSNSVSYAGIAFFPPRPDSESEAPMSELSAAEQDDLLRLARQTITALVSDKTIPQPSLADLPPSSRLREEHGVFVTLTSPGGRLRGCIGSIIGEQPLLYGVVQNAIASASRDPRFPPVEASEVPRLQIEISVLTPPAAISGPDRIVIGRDGVILEKGGRRAVFLPQVAPEQGWDVSEMLRNLCMKAGLGPQEWRSGAKLYTFRAQVFEEHTGRSKP
jgi:MEMO1 family protein